MKLNLTLSKSKDQLPKTLLLCALLTYGTTIYAEETKNTLAKSNGTSQIENVTQNLQQHKVTGQILDNNGEPVIGANVIVKGKSTGTITDIDGNFSINAADGDILSITYIGYLPKEVVVKGNTPLTIKMSEDAKMLDEVVVVGYGTQKKANLTGSVASVKMDDALGDRPIASTAQALQGTAPGLQIITNTGRPGQGSNLNIRGYTSINGGGPLVLVDNAEVESIDDINPKDI